MVRGQPKKSRLRIIGGRWRRRNIEFLDSPEIRPTPNRVRETLFNWLSDRMESAICLDLFSGSGVLGVEAVSRGAASATLVENNPLICKRLRHEVGRFETDSIDVVEGDAYAFIQQTTTVYDVIFIDPPFNSGLSQKILDAITENNRILKPTTLIYVEWEAETHVEPPEELCLIHKKQASRVRYALFGLNPGKI